MLGREAERAAIDRLMQSASAGAGGALVVRGAPGMGKSALLRYAESAAGDMLVLRATGVPVERELPFATLHQLLRPVFGQVDRLPDVQREALRGALALGPACGSDRFVVSAAVVGLLAECAEADALLCLVDDAHWVDRASLAALLFAARRLDSERVALVFAARDGEDQALIEAGLTSVGLRGLDADAAGPLLRTAADATPAPAVVAALVEATGGNPLALTEIAAMLSAAEITGAARLPEPLPISAGLERAFLTKARSLPPPSQDLLLVAAAEGTGDLPTVLAAGALLGVPPASLDAAEREGLIALSAGRVAFRHPLVRSGLYGGAAGPQRRRAHLALAEVLPDAKDADRRVWHRAAAALGPDEAVAAELALAATRARLRGGHAAAAAASRRSAELTPDTAARAERLVDTAEDAWLAGQPDTAYASLDEAARLSGAGPLVDRASHLRGRLELRRGVATEAFRLLFDGARAAADRAPAKALEMLVEAAEAAGYAGDPAGIITAGQQAALVGECGPEGELWRDMALGVGGLLAGDLAGSQVRLRRVIDGAGQLAEPSWLVWAGAAALYLGDTEAALGLYERAAELARIADMTGNLPYVLEFLAATERTRGRYSTSAALSQEGLHLARETGQETSECQHLANLAFLAALRGEESSCRRYAEEALARALPRRLGLAAGGASWALAVLDLGAGRFDSALARYQQLAAAGPGVGHPTITWYSLPERVEAAVACKDLDDARAAQAQLEAWTASAGATSMQAVAIASGALLAAEEEAESRFREALGRQESSGHPAERARTHLLYGEWLRRARRPREARGHLRTAMEVYASIGAAPWAERARLELRATGETTRPPDGAAVNRLTPQELRIAQLVSRGSSNRDIAARLFLSPRTVEYHLYKIYPKLGIGSRTDLVRVRARDGHLVDA